MFGNIFIKIFFYLILRERLVERGTMCILFMFDRNQII